MSALDEIRLRSDQYQAFGGLKSDKHSAEDVPVLLDALQSALELHKPEKRWMLSEDDDRSWDSEEDAREWMDGDEPEQELPFFEVCAECKRVEEGPCDGECILELGYKQCIWPCPTVKAITSALEANR